MRKVAWFVLLAMIVGGIACAGGAQSGPTETPVPTTLPTATPITLPPPPPIPPAELPQDSDLQDLILYANAMQPLLTQAGGLLQRDGAILEEAQDGNDAPLCDGRLEADNVTMKGILEQVRTITPPDDAAAIHQLVIRSGDAWTEALDNVEQFCDSGNAFYKVPAVLKFWEAAATLQDAGNRFWLLLISEGVEDWVRR